MEKRSQQTTHNTSSKRREGERDMCPSAPGDRCVRKNETSPPYSNQIQRNCANGEPKDGCASPAARWKGPFNEAGRLASVVG